MRGPDRLIPAVTRKVLLFIAGVMVGATSLTLSGIPVTFSQIIIGLLLLSVVFAGYLEEKFKMMWEDRSA